MPSWIEQLVARSTPPCREVTRLVSKSQETRLSLADRIRIQLHFSVCVWCARYANQLRAMRAALTRNADRLTEEQDQALPGQVRANMIARLCAEARNLQPVSSPRLAWRFKAAVFLAVPFFAALLARASQWCIACVEIEGGNSGLLVVLHAVLSWPFLLGRAVGLFSATPEGFPMCCFIGWTILGLVAVALWLRLSSSTTSHGNSALPA